MKKWECDQNEEARVTKRNGRTVDGLTKFINIIFEGDTEQIGAAISRFKYEDMAGMVREKVYLVRGDIIGDDDRKWIFIDNLVELESVG